MLREWRAKPRPEEDAVSDELGLPSAARDVQLAERVEITRELFDTHMRHVAFASWEELMAALAERPTGRGYTALRGESDTVIKLDPLRVFGWVAAFMINVGAWGLVAYFASSSSFTALLVTALYGAAIWLVVSRALAPALSGLLWPFVPLVVAVMGILVVKIVVEAADCCQGFKEMSGLLLLFSALPHTLATLVLMRSLPVDPDRATLVVNAFVGSYFVLLLPFVQLGVPEEAMYWLGGYIMLGLGLGYVAVAGRLFAVPGAWGSMELVSWTLNVGTLGAFSSVQMLLGVPYTEHWWPWLLYLPVPFALTLLGAVFARSFPVLLSAISFFQITVRASVAAATTFVGRDDYSSGGVVGLCTFGALGAAVICLAQRTLKSREWAKLTVDLRCSLARACGSSDPTHFWSETASAPLDASPAAERQLG